MKRFFFVFLPATLLAFVPYITHIMLEGAQVPLDADDSFAVITLFVMAVYLRHTVYISRQKLKNKAREFERVSNFNDMVLSGVADGIYAVDRDMRVTLWSKGAERLTGHRAEDVIGKPCKEFLHHTTEDGAPLCDTPNCPLVVMETKDILSSKIVTAHKSDGQRMLVSVTAAPLVENGMAVGAVEAFRDATKERELERIKEAMTNMLIHDFKNPLSVIGIVLETMRSDRKEINEKFVKMAYQAVGELDNMLVNLMEIAKMEKGFELKKETFRTEDMLMESVKKAEVMAFAAGQKIFVDIQSGLPQVSADRYLIMRVMGNLLGNAIKFTPSGGGITVSAINSLPSALGGWGRQGGGEIKITVSDTGPGISKQYHELIFDKYWQAGAGSMNARKGVGLGLAFCKMVVEAHGGMIWVESEEGEGSRFMFTIAV